MGAGDAFLRIQNLLLFHRKFENAALNFTAAWTLELELEHLSLNMMSDVISFRCLITLEIDTCHLMMLKNVWSFFSFEIFKFFQNQIFGEFSMTLRLCLQNWIKQIIEWLCYIFKASTKSYNTANSSLRKKHSRAHSIVLLLPENQTYFLK